MHTQEHYLNENHTVELIEKIFVEFQEEEE